MADSQVPWGVEALNGTISEPAWKTKPSWYLVATDDKMIPPPAQRFMSKRAGSTVVEVAGSHAIYMSQPRRPAGRDLPGIELPHLCDMIRACSHSCRCLYTGEENRHGRVHRVL